eukprot:IDg1848t1
MYGARFLVEGPFFSARRCILPRCALVEKFIFDSWKDLIDCSAIISGLDAIENVWSTHFCDVYTGFGQFSNVQNLKQAMCDSLSRFAVEYCKGLLDLCRTVIARLSRRVGERLATRMCRTAVLAQRLFRCSLFRRAPNVEFSPFFRGT